MVRYLITSPRMQGGDLVVDVVMKQGNMTLTRATIRKTQLDPFIVAVFEGD